MLSDVTFQEIFCILCLVVVVFLGVDGLTFGQGGGGNIQLKVQSI